MAEYRMVIPADWDLALRLAPTMRGCDRQEVWAAGHLTPAEAIRVSMSVSRDTRIWLVDDEVASVYGVGESNPVERMGVPWGLCSDLVHAHKKEFVKWTSAYVEELKERYLLLENYVDARNTHAVRWLNWLGFTLTEARPFGLDQMPFHRFYWKAE